jgi:hypothetical protein
MAEHDKVQAVVNALRAGADPDDHLDLVSLPVAASNWAQIDSFATDLSRFAPESGPAVTLAPGLPAPPR